MMHGYNISSSVSNKASRKLWQSTPPFSLVGIVPKAGRLKGHDELVDAEMWHCDFSKLPLSKDEWYKNH